MKIYIGNLDEKIQDFHLREAFQDFGTVATAKVIKTTFQVNQKVLVLLKCPTRKKPLRPLKMSTVLPGRVKLLPLKRRLNNTVFQER